MNFIRMCESEREWLCLGKSMKQVRSISVKPKKYLGQHFLNDEQIAWNIVEALQQSCETTTVLEIGPGMGVLTKYLLEWSGHTLYAVDVDTESIQYLKNKYPVLEHTLFEDDFLKMKLNERIPVPVSVIGNFPYNISSQIVFSVLDQKQDIPLLVGMFQKEVAERICAKPGNKSYGILSVLTQAFYDSTYLFTVPEHVFTPPPKVKSGVIRLVRKSDVPDVPEDMLYRVVKTAFNQRRKKLRNALQSFQVDDVVLKDAGYLDKRAEELSLEQFIHLTKVVLQHGTQHH